MEIFRKLGIIEPVLKVIEEEKFEKPTEIQEKAIPFVIQGKDVIAGSATGSGKTLVFGVPIIQNSEKGKHIQALVLTPTRELAEQVKKHLKMFSKYKPLFIISIYGGVAIGPQMDHLQKADVVVGTPGRVLDHIRRGTVDFRNVRTLVLDEADKMFEMGFVEDVEDIIKACSKERQTLLFSATITDDVFHISKRYMKNPMKISAGVYVDPKKLKQVYYDVPNNMRFSLLVHLLKNEHSGLVMVFCNSRDNTDFIANNLNNIGIEAVAIHGGFSQAKRNKTMEDFHSKNVKVLVCTDVAARGLDIKGVSHIYNYDIPKESKQYIHRIGRTARAGEEGKAINLLSDRDYDNFSRVVRDNDVNIVKEQMPVVERVKIGWMKRRGGFRSQGREYSRGFGDRGRGYGGSDNRGRYHPRGSEHRSNDNRGEKRFSGEGRSEGRGEYRSHSGQGSSRGPSRSGGNRGFDRR
jgi:ATP-dependent RNA helicase DeaD